ncbi:Asp23/Gls24 family envelope stress response protein [Halanaerobium sp. MA284_MarDTE_T2]|uniref:Asp23/Gls24 family envelope stress response protein n=1 Tax=Halanaerobium sp. MA284_MarDTE_T2 TaxID=2183913 RepID=UPI000DF1F121|nr:Asp23/Gls24 family envelope stress response protein [Halanaerobium sp. MA284_MarDTE_T2]RCW50538.1 putative alkaline shock family protein YloU [Halanaerobium sp. MA284_MarDTE_T2]
MTENKKNYEEKGKIKIADEVVSIITGLAATEVEGVVGMSGGIAGGIADLLGRKNLSKGVKVEVTEETVEVDIFVIIEYGNSIPEVAWEIQNNVKQAIEGMTGLDVKSVNVHVQGVNFPDEEEDQVEEVEVEEVEEEVEKE